jgi:protein tyrosine/serine phosphatase
MRSAINFRDFGDAPSRHGGRVRTDRLYRCGHLAAVAPDDVKALLGLDFALIADLRYARERETDRSPWPVPYAARLLAHDGERSNKAPHLELLAWVRAGKASMKERAIGFYRKLPLNRHYRLLFGRVLTGLADADGRLLVHCTAGKDRTGILCGLILHALGVPRDAILADYMRSRRAPGLPEMAAAIATLIADELGRERAEALTNQMHDVDEDYLLAAFATMEAECGSIDAYLESLGLDADRGEALRERLLV